MEVIWGNFWKVALAIFLVRFIWCFVKDFIGMIRYYRADVQKGRVIKSLGPVEEAAYIQGHSRLTHTFENYEVEYYFNGQRLNGNVLSSKKDLKAGDFLEVHALDRNGVPEIQTDTCGKKIKFFVGVILFSVLGTVALVTFYTMTH